MWYYWIGVIVYLFFLEFLFNFVHKDFKKNKKLQKRFLFFALLPVFFLMAFRNPLAYSGDILSYYNYFLRVGRTSWGNIFGVLERFEHGYPILNKILYTICPWGQAIIIFESAFCLITAGVFIYKNTDNPFLAILTYMSLGFLNIQMTGFRQGIAIGILMISVEFVKKKRFIPFALLVLLAFFFHKTSIIFIVTYFILNRKFTLPWHIFTSVATVLIGYYLGVILDFSTDLFELDEYGLGYGGSSFGGIVIIAFFTIILILSFIYHKKSNSFQLYANMTEVGFFLYVLRYIAISMERVSIYYSFGSIIAFPNVLESEEHSVVRTIEKVVFSAAFALYFIYTASYSQWAVFKPFWS